MYGDDVATLQARLQDLGFYTSMVDGHFGLQTHNALMSYQRASTGCPPTASAGPETLRSLYFLGSWVTGGSPHAIHEEEPSAGPVRGCPASASSSIRAVAVPTTV